MNNQKKNESEKNRVSVLRQLASLRIMSLEDLRKKWFDLYGTEAPEYQKEFLLRKLAYRIQELYYGGLSQYSLSILKKGCDQNPFSVAARVMGEKKRGRISELAGTRFVRIYNDRKHEVTAHENGYEYEGIIYRSLTAVAEKITGTHWSGKAFFGVNKKNGGQVE